MMEYTVRGLSRLAHVSGRTLRYYDEIDLLKPARTNSSGYRIYGRAQVDRLQEILFYKQLGLELDEIKKVMGSPDYNADEALRLHYVKLLDQRNRLEALIQTVEKTIASREGRAIMTDAEKFEGFKQQMVKNNEEKFGAEIQKKYGEEVLRRSNEQVLNMTKEQYEELQRLEEEMLGYLVKAMEAGDPACEDGWKAADLHRQWLSFYWNGYSAERHAGLANTYVDDPRFAAYYDGKRPGMARFLRDAVLHYIVEEE